MQLPASARSGGPLLHGIRSFSGRYFTVPRPQEPFSKGSQLVDLFEYDWKAKRYIPNALQAG